jgi:hypothetical protein
MDSSPQGIRRVPSSGTGGIKRVPSGGTGGTYDVLSPVGSHGMSLDYGKTTKTHNRTTHSHSQSKTSKRQSKVARTILRDNTPRKDSWMSLMQMANSKRHSLKVNTVARLLHSLEAVITLLQLQFLIATSSNANTQVWPLPGRKITLHFSCSLAPLLHFAFPNFLPC